jgi:hypothetical protein
MFSGWTLEQAQWQLGRQFLTLQETFNWTPAIRQHGADSDLMSAWSNEGRDGMRANDGSHNNSEGKGTGKRPPRYWIRKHGDLATRANHRSHLETRSADARHRFISAPKIIMMPWCMVAIDEGSCRDYFAKNHDNYITTQIMRSVIELQGRIVPKCCHLNSNTLQNNVPKDPLHCFIGTYNVWQS